MDNDIYAQLKGNGRVHPVFEGIDITAELRESLALTTITQRYGNRSKKNIEAVYTFPLPLDAVLLDFSVTLGEKTMKGRVLPKVEAEEEYEDAITDGDAPVMLQNPAPGLYTMNVGNLLPGEKAVISFTYGIFMQWQGDSLRYFLPTTIAPRYGSASRAGLEPQQEPESSMLTDNRFSFRMSVTGSMSGRRIECPSHAISIVRNRDENGCTLTIDGNNAYMDRDIIILVRREGELVSSALLARDGDGFIVWGSFQPRFDLPENPEPRSIKIIVDCSGSMQGDSIAQARESLIRILDELRPQDFFNIIAFGDRATPLFDIQKEVTQESLSYARGFLKKLEADMGGTQIGAAIDMAVRIKCPASIAQDILIITDGEIWQWERVVRSTEKSKHRIFTIGVGSSVSEPFVRELAEKTGGACELVSPDENMAERIHLHFRRIGTPVCTEQSIAWPSEPIRTFPETRPPIFDGDTHNVFGWFSEPVAGEMALEMTLPDGSTRTMTAPIGQLPGDADDTIARMAAARKLRDLEDPDEAQELAVRYRLVSRWTHCLAIVERAEDEKADTLPDLHKVQQMLAAGWGGTGSVRCESYAASGYNRSQRLDVPCFVRSPSPAASYTRINPIAPPVSFMDDDDSIDMPLFHRKSVDIQESSTPAWKWDSCAPDELVAFSERLEVLLMSNTLPTSISLDGLPSSLFVQLNEIVDAGYDEMSVAAVFIYTFVHSDTGKQYVSRTSRRIVSKAFKALSINLKKRLEIEGALRIQPGTGRACSEGTPEC